MKGTVFAFSLMLLLVFSLGIFTHSAYAQVTQPDEQAKIQELQAIISQLLGLLADLQKQVFFAAQQTYIPVYFSNVPPCAQAEIAWEKVSGATDYVLYRNGIEVYKGRSLKFTDTELLPSTTYTYMLRAKNAGGLGNASPIKTLTTSSNCPPVAPIIWGQAGACGGIANIWWSRSAGATFYELFRNNTRVSSVNTLAFIDRGLSAQRSYTYKMRGGNSGGLGEFSEAAVIQSSAVCPPNAPEELEIGTPFLDDALAQEGRFKIEINSSPSGVTAESSKGAKTILGFNASAEDSAVFVERIDADFSDRAWLFLKEVRILDGSRVISTIQVSENSFSRVADNTYRISFTGLTIQVLEGRSKTISVAVVAKDDLTLLEPRQIFVSIPTHSVRGRDQINVAHFGPIDSVAKPFFVKREVIKP